MDFPIVKSSQVITMGRLIFPPKLPLPLTDPYYVHASSLDPSDQPYQTASRCDPLFFHNAMDRQTDTQTDRWLKGMVCAAFAVQTATRPNNTKVSIFYCFGSKAPIYSRSQHWGFRAYYPYMKSSTNATHIRLIMMYRPR